MNRTLFSLLSILLLLGIVLADASADGSQTETDRWSSTFDHLRDMQPCWGKLDVKAVAARQQSGEELVLIDVRTPREWQQGIVPGAMLLNLNSLPSEAMLEKLPDDKATPIVVYCKAGHRATLAMTYLQYIGYSNAIVMSGGYTAWKQAGLPVANP